MLLLCTILVALTAACNLSQRNTTPTGSAATTEVTAATESAAVASPTLPPATTTPRPTDPPATATPTKRGTPGCNGDADWVEYAVRTGDTLNKIAQRAGISTTELAQSNCITNPDTVYVGQVIYLPKPILPTSTPTRIPPTATTAPPLMFYLVAPNDNGASGPMIGCQDSIVAVDTGQDATGSLATQMAASLAALFTIGSDTYGQSGFVDELNQSILAVRDINISATTVTINLTGSLKLSGICSDERQQAQILYTVFQYKGFQTALIKIGDKNMKQLFDASGLVTADATYSRSDVSLP